MRNRAPAFALILALAACGGDSSSPTTSSTPEPTAGGECGTLGQVNFVRDTLQEWYLWYQQLPDPDPAGFDSPEAYLQAVRYLPRDSSFSYIGSQAATDAFYSDSQFIGIGLSFRQTGTTELRVSQVFPGGPAAAAGLARGDYMLTIDGRSVAALLQSGQLNDALGPAEIGFSLTLGWRSPGGPEREATVTKRLVTIPTVSATRVFDNGGSRAGYIFFRNFVTPSTEALNRAFDRLRADGATDLVLDLRYNGGGLVSVAQHLASLIGGEGTAGRIFVKFRHNDKKTANDETVSFESKPNALDLPRLVVIATGSSASASELVINSLRPFMNVTVVGARTFGKPVGQYGFDFCEKVLFPVAFATENAEGEADYFNGIPANCAAPDDLNRQIADPGEGSLAEALQFLRTGHCSGRAAAEAEVQAQRRAVLPRPYEGDPWRQLVGAY
ncbi:MAG: peptidase [Acidobacteria bacterium]|nr:peptidase [Acidobacteriota bacterium]